MSGAVLARMMSICRMLVKIDELCAERDRLVGLDRRKYPGTNKFINGPAERRYR
jgi:hypothetical protein